jgi:hypothetical protein
VIGKKAQVKVATINPKCLSLSELHGEFNSNTMEWKDGLLSRLFRKFSCDSNAIAVSTGKANREKEDSHILTPIGKPCNVISIERAWYIMFSKINHTVIISNKRTGHSFFRDS